MLDIKLNGKTLDIAEENIKKLREIFPDVFIEDKVDFEKLKQILGEYIETSNERYNFSWNGKAKALRISQTPSTGTLRPCKEESKDWDTTQNLYIEGDNLEVLKLLQKSYHRKVKMIYIDPPYNTGNDFVYPDDFTDNIENYKRITGQVDEEGRNISSNKETNGRYHTDWLNMMYPRLRLARNLLADDGVIFISIDDNEVDNLKKICNEVFGEENFIACIIWERAFSPVNLKKHFSENHDYILCYSKLIEITECNGLKRNENNDSRYKNLDNDLRGVWTSSDMTVGPVIESKLYDIITPNGKTVRPSSGRCWLFTEDRYYEMLKDNRIWFGENGDNMPRVKKFLTEVKDGITPLTIWKYQEVGHSQDAQQKLKSLFSDKAYFDYPKSVELINRMLELYSNKDSIILDFFSGSATTAHAVMQLNAEDGGNRKFIMVQLPEPTEEKDEAYKAGYKNICEIGKERIRRAGEKIKEEKGLEVQKLDTGFKVLKLDYSNIRRWQPDYNNLEESIADYIDNFMEGRTELDVVYEIMLKYGLDLTYPVDEYTICNKKVYAIGYGMLVICLDNELTTDIAKGILDLINKLEPKTTRVVFKDNSFKTDSNKTNIKEILKCGGVEEFITI